MADSLPAPPQIGAFNGTGVSVATTNGLVGNGGGVGGGGRTITSWAGAPSGSHPGIPGKERVAPTLFDVK